MSSSYQVCVRRVCGVPECTSAVAEAEYISLNSTEYTFVWYITYFSPYTPYTPSWLQSTFKFVVCVHDMCVKGQARAVNKLYDY
jgi:hypothetical protein